VKGKLRDDDLLENHADILTSGRVPAAWRWENATAIRCAAAPAAAVEANHGRETVL
jgi:hypothetical protein